MPSQSYIEKYVKTVRTREQIQQPFEKPKKHIIPVDIIVRRTVKPYTIYDHTVLEQRSEAVQKFITTGR